MAKKSFKLNTQPSITCEEILEDMTASEPVVHTVEEVAPATVQEPVKDKKKMQCLNVRLSPELYVKAKRHCFEKSLSTGEFYALNTLINEAIEAYLK